jgi:hypothetical protein
MSALNVTSIADLVRYADHIRTQFDASIAFRPSMVMWPDFQSPLILLDSDYPRLDHTIRLVDSIGGWTNLSERLGEIRAAAASRGDVTAQRATFYRWFSEYDRRRRTDFLSTFADLAEFWAACARAAGGPT